MKKFVLAFGLTLLVSFAPLLVVSAGDLECTDLSGCGGSPSCNGPGTPSGCTIVCEGGGTIVCDDAVR